MTDPARCPFHEPQSLPGDSTPLRPSPTINAWRDAAPAVPLAYDDGHVGLVVTRYDAARAILGDTRFSQRPHRMPVSPGHPAVRPDDDDRRSPAPLDDAARASIDAANLLALDGAVHQRMRRAITSRFSVKQVRGREPWVRELVRTSLDRFVALGPGADLFAEYAQPIAAATHCRVIGVPDDLVPLFVERFVGTATTQQQFDFIRTVVDRRVGDPGEDVITDLLASDATRIETEGLVFQLMSAGRDSVAYLIATATTALLTHPDQTEALRTDPARIAPAIEEFMRTGAMFLTLFPRARSAS